MLAAAYALLVVWLIVELAVRAGIYTRPELDPLLSVVVVVGLIGLLWRAILRFVFTTSEYGPIEGLMGVMRMPIANIIAIISARRAFAAYLGSLRGRPAVWDKTTHHRHPLQAHNEAAQRG